MKKISLLLLLACISIGTMRAQVKSNGYYRVQNVTTGRYMSLTTEETRGISMQSTTVDASALLTKKNWDDVSTDPGTIFYIENKGGDQYNIIGQGSSLYKSSTIISASNIMRVQMYTVPGNPRVEVPSISATNINIHSAKIQAM